jgi:DnaJ-class molecular chaperone
MGVVRDYIQCPTCHGSGYEPSAITSCRTWCSYCFGDGYFRGTSRRLMSVAELQAALAKDRISALPPHE